MGGPKEVFRLRPRKTGAARKQRMNAQKKRLITAGFDKALVAKMSATECRQAQKKIAGKKRA